MIDALEACLLTALPPYDHDPQTRRHQTSTRSSRGMEDDRVQSDVKQGRTPMAKVTYLGTGGPVEIECPSPEHEAALIEALWLEMQPYLLQVERDSLRDWERDPKHADLQAKAEQKICALRDAKTGAEGAALCGEYVSYLGVLGRQGQG